MVWLNPQKFDCLFIIFLRNKTRTQGRMNGCQFQLAQLVKTLILEYEIYGLIPVYMKNRLISWSDSKKHNY